MKQGEAMSEDAKLFDTLFTMRAMRRLKPDPVDPELIEQILRAGQAAPNGGNAQNWGFMVIDDLDIKKQVQERYQRAYDEFVGKHYASQIEAMPEGADRDKYVRQVDAVAHLTNHFHEAPVWIIACHSVAQGANPGSGASIYPAVQNMLLAARALGLGATLTSRHMIFGKEVDAILGLPDDFMSFAILPIGHPIGTFGPVGRGPLEDIVHLNQWGQNYF